MYGPRPKSANLVAQLGISDQAGESHSHSATVTEDASHFRARVLVQAVLEPCPGVPRLQRLPLELSTSQLNDIEPAARDFKLRCDLFEAVGLPIGTIEGVYAGHSPG